MYLIPQRRDRKKPRTRNKGAGVPSQPARARDAIKNDRWLRRQRAATRTPLSLRARKRPHSPPARVVPFQTALTHREGEAAHQTRRGWHLRWPCARRHDRWTTRAARRGQKIGGFDLGSTKLTTTPVKLDRLTIEEHVHRRGAWSRQGISMHLPCGAS